MVDVDVRKPYIPKCPIGYTRIGDLCVPDGDKFTNPQGADPPPVPPVPPTPPPPPKPKPIKPSVIINLSNMVALDAQGVLLIASIAGIELTKDDISNILAGQSVDGFSYNPGTGDVSVRALLGRPNPDGTRPLIGTDEEGIEMIVWDDTQTPAVFRNIVSGAENEELTPLLEETRQLAENAGAGIEMTPVSPVEPVEDIIQDIMEMDDKALAEWFVENKDTATTEQMEAYNERLNQLTDIALNPDETEPLVDVDIDAPVGTGLTKEEMELLSPEDFYELGRQGGLSTQEIIDYNTIVIERAQLANPTQRVFNEMKNQLEPYSEAQIEAMTDEELQLVLESMTQEELKTLNKVNPDFLQGLDEDIIAQIQFDDLVAQAVEQGATDAEIEAMETGFADAGILGAEGAVDLPLTILAGGATALAWLDGDKDQKKEIAKDAGKAQSWLDTNVVEPAEMAVSITAKEMAEGFKETGDAFNKIFHGKNPFKAVTQSPERKGGRGGKGTQMRKPPPEPPAPPLTGGATELNNYEDEPPANPNA